MILLVEHRTGRSHVPQGPKRTGSVGAVSTFCFPIVAGEAIYLLGWQVVQIFYYVNSDRFLLCYLDLGSETRLPITVHLELLLP